MSRSKLKLASFDGGSARGLSQLEIMGTVMHRLRCDRYPNDPDKIMLPCEHFDLIGGAGTGGLIAIMLAKLRMSVDEASEEFFVVVEEVYKPKNLTPVERTQKLRECMEDLLKKKGLPINLKLTGETPAGQCAGFVMANLGVNAASKVVLRTYLVRSQLPSPITVIDAMLASCSAQPDFAPVSSGSGYKKKVYVAAGLGANNPVSDVITEAHELFGGDSSLAFLLSLGTGHPGTIPIPPEGNVDIHRLMRDMMNDCEQRAQEVECNTRAFSGGFGCLRVVSLTGYGAVCKTTELYSKRGGLSTRSVDESSIRVTERGRRPLPAVTGSSRCGWRALGATLALPASV